MKVGDKLICKAKNYNFRVGETYVVDSIIVSYDTSFTLSGESVSFFVNIESIKKDNIVPWVDCFYTQAEVRDMKLEEILK
jgi:hypothetical protein